MNVHTMTVHNEKKYLYSKLVAASRQIGLNFAKLILFPDTPYTKTWMYNIWASLNYVDMMKKTKKWPDQEFILSCLQVHNDSVAIASKTVALGEEFDLDARQTESEDILYYIEEYQEWVSFELSWHGTVFLDDAYEAIEDILRR